MDIKEMIFGTVGGLGLFLFGMSLMSDGLKKVAGQKLKNILESMTRRRIAGFAVGTGVTALIQSSSAATVMVVGFVNAGLLTLKQAIPVVIGTNVGTTATAWLVSISAGIEALKVSEYALPLVGLGFLLQVLGKTRRTKSIGQIMLGFGILFLGVEYMKGAFGDLKSSEQIQHMFKTFAEQPILAILAGAVMTMLLQSSSASIAIVQAMAMGGAFGDLETAVAVVIPFVLGSNIGTTITAQIAAVQANRNSKRVAWAHTLFNVVGSILSLPLIYLGWFSIAVRFIAPWEASKDNVEWDIALAHTLFNVGNSIIFLPLTGVLAWSVVKLLPEQPGEAGARPVVLEQHLLDTPVLALEQARSEIVRMAHTAKKALNESIEGILNSNRQHLQAARELEDYVDTFQLEITSYLTALSARQLDDEVSIELPVLLHTVNDLERIADHAVNIAEVADRKIEQKLSFSDSALGEAGRLRQEIEEMFDCVVSALEDNDAAQARGALPYETNLNSMQIEFRRSHVQRMTDGLCTPETGLVFIDLVDNIEKIGDHLTNIAQAIIGGLQWEGVKPSIRKESSAGVAKKSQDR